MNAQIPSPPVQTDADDAVAALADLASQLLLANTVGDRVRLAAHAVQAHLGRPVGAAVSEGRVSAGVAWVAADEDAQGVVLDAVRSVLAHSDRSAVGTVVRASVDRHTVAVVDAGSGWVAVMDPPEEDLGFLEAVSEVVASALSSGTSTPEDVDTNLVWSAHELRSPLLTVRTAIERAIRTRRASERRQLLEGGLRELETLSAVTESLLRFRPDGTDGDGRAVDLGELVAEMLADESDAVDVESRCDPGVCAIVDPVRFRIAVMNLVRNAHAHADDATVVVRVFRDGDRSVVSVEDRGGGVAPELRERIFEPYVRGHGSPGATQGSGLGLHICRRIIEGHGGNVTIGERDGGSVFRIDLPWSDEGRDRPSAS